MPSAPPPLFALAPGLHLVLASASPRRQQFLARWGLPFLLCPAPTEPRPARRESPQDYTCRAARAKALWACDNLASCGLTPPSPGCAVILAADTVVAVDNDILGKPVDAAHALCMLERLAGRGHEVVSAVCLLLPDGAGGQRQKTFFQTSRVFFHAWPRSVLQAYVDTGEPEGKAGAYAIQGQGAVLVERVEGCWSTVVGLPLTLLAQVLLEEGVMRPATQNIT